MKINQILGRLLAAVFTAVMVAVPAQATLVGRDINGLAVAGSSDDAVFLYDTDLNITWLRDANAGAESSLDNGFSTTDGRMTWVNANSWANTLTVGSYSGWRLPATMQPDATCSQSFNAGVPFGVLSFGFNCTGSEMGHLWYTELGNTGDQLISKIDNFQNLLHTAYWSGPEYAPHSFRAWSFNIGIGYQVDRDKDLQFFAMAVRPGDVLVAQVPEPESLVLALTALSALALVRRRRAVGASAL